jgi:hypothetical protein
MGRAQTDIIIHVNEKLDEVGVRDVEQELRDHGGVLSATHEPGKNHLLRVVYDPEATRAINLLPPLKARGLHAQLIGL